MLTWLKYLCKRQLARYEAPFTSLKKRTKLLLLTAANTCTANFTSGELRTSSRNCCTSLFTYEQKGGLDWDTECTAIITSVHETCERVFPWTDRRMSPSLSFSSTLYWRNSASCGQKIWRVAKSWYISLRLCRHLVMFSLLILASKDDICSSQRWWAQCTWKRVHFSISVTVRGQQRCCWIISYRQKNKLLPRIQRVWLHDSFCDDGVNLETNKLKRLYIFLFGQIGRNRCLPYECHEFCSTQSHTSLCSCLGPGPWSESPGSPWSCQEQGGGATREEEAPPGLLMSDYIPWWLLCGPPRCNSFCCQYTLTSLLLASIIQYCLHYDNDCIIRTIIRTSQYK